MSLHIKRRIFSKPAIQLSTSTKWIGYLSVLSLLSILSILFHNQDVGSVIVLVFGLTLLLFGVKSEEIFRVVAVTLVIVVLTSIVRIDVIAQDFSTYAFLLLLIGLVSIVKEYWMPSKDVSDTSYVSGVYSRNYQAMRRVKRQFTDRRSH